MFDVDRFHFFAVLREDLDASVRMTINAVAAFPALMDETRVDEQLHRLVKSESAVSFFADISFASILAFLLMETKRTNFRALSNEGAQKLVRRTHASFRNERRRCSIIHPRVARHELPWGKATVSKQSNHEVE